MENKREMDKKRLLLIGSIGAAVLIFIFGILFTLGNRKLEGVTRGEWIYSLTEAFQIVKYEEETPYFSDVNTDSSYFDSVQAACEWGMLEAENSFYGEEVATGEFVALTAMKAVGNYKVQIYLGLKEAPSKEDYLELALEKELISQKMLDKGVTKEEAEEIILKAQDLYYSGLWLDDYVDIQYQQNVLELNAEDILSINEDYTEMLVDKALLQKIAIDTSIILPQAIAGESIARKVTEITENGMVTLADTKLEEVISSFIVSDMARVSVEDIFEYNRSLSDVALNAENAYTTLDGNTIVPLQMRGAETINKTYHDSGFMVGIESDEGKLSLLLTDNLSGITFALSTGIKVDSDANIEVTVNIKNIDVGVQVIHNGLDVEYTNVQVESDISVQGKVTMESELDPIPLFKVPVYLGNGTIGVEIPLYLVISAEGSISIEAGVPVQLACEYISGNGFRPNVNINCHVNIEANCTAKGVLRIDPILQLRLLGILEVNVLDVEADIGIEASASTTARINSHIIGCTDLSVAAPTVSVEFLGDEDNPTLLSEILPSVSFDIIDSETARFQANWHYEEYTDGTLLKVEECTYGGDNRIDYLVRVYVANFESEFIDEGDYYTTTGKVYHTPYIPADVAKTLSPGDDYTYEGKIYTFEGIVDVNELFGETGGRVYDMEVGEEDTRYYKFSVSGEPAVYFSYAPPTEPSPMGENYALDEGYVYKYVYYLSKYLEDDFIMSDMVMVADDYEFKIKKDAMVEIMTADTQGGNENAFTYAMYTVEECFENGIADYQGNVLTEGMPMDIDVYFTPEGYVEHIYVYPDIYGRTSHAEYLDAVENHRPLTLE